MAEIEISVLRPKETRALPYFTGKPRGPLFNAEHATIIMDGVKGANGEESAAVVLSAMDGVRPCSIQASEHQVRTIMAMVEGGKGSPKGDPDFIKEKDGMMYLNFSKAPVMQEVTKLEIRGMDTNKVSDGYHTFGELYQHRIINFIALCRQYWKLAELSWFKDPDNRGYGGINPDRKIWRSQLHSNGTMFEGWFVLGIGEKPGEQITYHMPLGLYWELTDFAVTLELAPEWDGHTSQDVLDRITKLLIS